MKSSLAPYKFGVVLSLLLLTCMARAETPPPDTAGSYAFERSLVLRAMTANHLTADASPEGKTIERVLIVPYDVVDQDDLYPQWFNVFHDTTKASVVERELLFRRGDAWKADNIDESSRNLRSNLFLATAKISAAQGSSSNRVIAVVVTKDLWSLRPEMSYSLVGSRIELLQFEPAEYNLLGRDKTLGGDFQMDLARFLAGERYLDPRVLGSRVNFSEQGDVIWNRSTGAFEGGVVNLTLGQPLYRLDTKWAWDVDFNYLKDIYRLFDDGELRSVPISETGEILPYSYREQTKQYVAEVTRSYGHETKQNVTFGYHAILNQYGLPDLSPTVQPESIAVFESAIVPYSENIGKFLLTYHLYQATFLELLDIETFAVTEDFRIGPDLQLEIGWANRAFGFDSNFIEPRIHAGYLWKFGDDYFTLTSNAQGRLQKGIVQGSNYTDESASIGIRNVSPRFGRYRLHAAASYLRRANDLNNTVSTLGGDSSLRGYPSGYYAGPQAWTGNLELRSLAYEWDTVHIGWAAFLDSGDAFQDPAQIAFHMSAGAGIRVGFPQFNHAIWRVDFGVPFSATPGASPSYVVSTFGQAF